ncbi:MAG: peptidoglycan DD-metalloendopeptidase family protein [Sulfurospirillum sp.]|nr:peptidoglycan DD-metalloendopeptidase family protein [Sulfurospirillum sp.]
MFRLVFVCLVLGNFLFASSMIEQNWEKGETLLTFFEKNSIPLSLYYDLDREDQELASEIVADVKFLMLKSDEGVLEQVLIPIGDELQIHITNTADKYEFTTIPIAYEQSDEVLSVQTALSPYQDIINATNNYLLAHEFIQAFQNSINFKALQKGDKVVVFYTKRTRLGKQYASPLIQAAMVELRGRPHFVFRYNDDRFYDVNAKEIEGFFLARPVNFTRISSSFTYKRWHPVLKKYRAHLGVDYAAPKGTPIKAAGDGKIAFAGTKNGYGKTVTINHQDSYKTLYAHMNGFAQGIRSGKWVKKGQVIGYVGSTGLSTGPHLHLGLYRGDRAINPASVVKVTKNALKGKEKEEFLRFSEGYKQKIQTALLEQNTPQKEKSFDYMVALE